MRRFGCSFDVKEMLDRMYARGDLDRLRGGAEYPPVMWYVVHRDGIGWFRDYRSKWAPRDVDPFTGHILL